MLSVPVGFKVGVDLGVDGENAGLQAHQSEFPGRLGIRIGHADGIAFVPGKLDAGLDQAV